ncbi:uncharacterized protein BXIN_2044 [Babesia sp. Xinjiang]|uniref:uncharacterized protein n=1 Tax=Babesia sp. Xinjiang TaxID=462227 RepID=UPI000A231093|nr:uncharacterized protein BXIN_2044 [Babesia sp. Xinjiang]ORM40541.1 hypothetical protein BXIN_2044 [Babesia sp. Xinjiang]
MDKTTPFLALFLLYWLGNALCLNISSRKPGPIQTHSLAALGGSGIRERTFQRRWRIHSKLRSDTAAELRQELLKIAKNIPNTRKSLIDDTKFVQAEAERILKIILPDNFEIFLGKYYDIKHIKHRGFMGDLWNWLVREEEFVTYSAWQYRPNILYKGGNLTLELHYKIPVNSEGKKLFVFEPIVVYTCDVSPGKYIAGTARFNPGNVEILTHPFLPWKRITAGSFQILAPSLPTVFSR